MSMSKLNRFHKDGIAILGTQGNYGAAYKVCGGFSSKGAEKAFHSRALYKSYVLKPSSHPALSE